MLSPLLLWSDLTLVMNSLTALWPCPGEAIVEVWWISCWNWKVPEQRYRYEGLRKRLDHACYIAGVTPPPNQTLPSPLSQVTLVWSFVYPLSCCFCGVFIAVTSSLAVQEFRRTVHYRESRLPNWELYQRQKSAQGLSLTTNISYHLQRWPNRTAARHQVRPTR